VPGIPSDIPVGVPPFEGILGHLPGPSTDDTFEHFDRNNELFPWTATVLVAYFKTI
jgi:hypothetical protein